jgi:hypothetical protein
MVKNKLYLWKKIPKKHSFDTNDASSNQTIRPTSVGMSQSKLKQLAWSLDTNNLFDNKKKH